MHACAKFAVLAVALLFASISTVRAADGFLEASGHSVGYGELNEEWRGEVIHVSWAPRIFVLKNFLSEDECDHIISLAKPNLQTSEIVEAKTGRKLEITASTSSGAKLAPSADDIIKRIESRVAQVSMIPAINQEPIQVYRYAEGQQYAPHVDFMSPDRFRNGNGVASGGQRAATLVMYLTTPDDGGETIFPQTDAKLPSASSWSSCAKKGGYAIKPRRGDAVLFYSLRPDGNVDDKSVHGSCPVLKGEKWTATKYIHTHKYPTQQ